MKVLNVGGGGDRIIPKSYDGWDQVLLDIDPSCNPDICIDAKDMKSLPAGEFDSVWCSHNLEHYHQFEVPMMLDNFKHVLNDDGYAQIMVPNLGQLFKDMRDRNYDIMDVWYRTLEGVHGQTVTFHDALFGWNHALVNDKPYYAHKCGFTVRSLHDALMAAGFKSVWVANAGINIIAFAYKKEGVPCP